MYGFTWLKIKILLKMMDSKLSVATVILGFLIKVSLVVAKDNMTQLQHLEDRNGTQYIGKYISVKYIGLLNINIKMS